MDTVKDHWIGFDLGGTKMFGAVYNRDFKRVGTCRKKTKGHEGAAAGLKRINDVIRGALEDAGVEAGQVGGMGIGCPGPLDLKRGILREAPNLGWEKVPVRDSIQDAFGFPVRVGNDVDFGVFGEYTFGAGRGARCVVGLFPGTGIGGGCVYEGKIFRGANCTCMEIGHIPIGAGGLPDGAGNIGTLEAVASRLAIAGAAAQASYRGQARTLQKSAGTDISNIRSGQLADSIKSGDKSVERIVKAACGHLAIGVVTLVHLLAPDVVVLGGGLVEAMPDLFVDTISKEVANRVLPSMKDVYQIRVAELGDDSAIMGAAAAARDEFASSPTQSVVTT
ncbi:MAG: ROK family protein [Pirellulaceae bacterium]